MLLWQWSFNAEMFGILNCWTKDNCEMSKFQVESCKSETYECITRWHSQFSSFQHSISNWAANIEHWQLSGCKVCFSLQYSIVKCNYEMSILKLARTVSFCMFEIANRTLKLETCHYAIHVSDVSFQNDKLVF